MYSEKDFEKSSREAGLRLALGIALICLFLGIVILFTVLKWQIPQLIAAGLGFIVCFFIWSLKIMPWLHYNKFMRELKSGRRRQTECEFIELSNETRMYDNVEVRDVLVTVGKAEEDQRLFILDADKQLPALESGDRIVITSFGNFITDIASA